MFTRLSASWNLARLCLSVLAKDKELMCFPVLSAATTIIVIASFLVPGYYLIPQLEPDRLQLVVGLACFPFYFATQLVVLFFNTALLCCARKRFEGGDPTVMDGVRAGFDNFGRLCQWAVVGGVVGVVVHQLQRRLPFLARMMGGAWAVVSYFALPVMVFEKVGPRQAVRRSKELIFQRWGETLGAYLGLGAVNGVLALLALLLLAGSGALSLSLASTLPLAVTGVVLALVALVVGIISSCLAHIFQAALYVYAMTNELPSGFQKEVLQGAFRS